MKKFIVFPGLIFMLFTGCDFDNHKLLLINNTNHIIYYRLLDDSAQLQSGMYVRYLGANDSVRPLFVRGGNGSWEYRINHYSPDSTLNIYLFDDTVITNLTIKHSKFKRMRLKVKDLNRLHWKVTIN